MILVLAEAERSTRSAAGCMSETQTSFVFRIAMIAAIGGLLFGYDTGIIASTYVFLNIDYQLTPFFGEMIVSSVVLGAFFSALITGRLVNYFGRRNMLLIAATIAIVGTLLSGIATHPAEVILGRFILGIAIGISSFK